MVCLLVLYLSFTTTKSAYDRCCKGCHGICFNCFVKSTSRKIERATTIAKTKSSTVNDDYYPLDDYTETDTRKTRSSHKISALQ